MRWGGSVLWVQVVWVLRSCAVMRGRLLCKAVHSNRGMLPLSLPAALAAVKAAVKADPARWQRVTKSAVSAGAGQTACTPLLRLASGCSVAGKPSCNLSGHPLHNGRNA